MGLWDRDWDYEGLNASELARYTFYITLSIPLDLIADSLWDTFWSIIFGILYFIAHEITTTLQTTYPVLAILFFFSSNLLINFVINEKLRHIMKLSYETAKTISAIISLIAASTITIIMIVLG